MKHVVAGLLMLAVTGVLAPRAEAESYGALPLQAKEGGADGGKATKKRLSDAQIKQILIDESIAAYSGNCPVSVQYDVEREEVWAAERVQS